MEEEDDRNFPDWKGSNEYQEPIGPTSLLANFVSVSLEAVILLNYCVEWKVILNVTTKYGNEVLRDESNETIKFHRM